MSRTLAIKRARRLELNGVVRRGIVVVADIDEDEDFLVSRQPAAAVFASISRAVMYHKPPVPHG